MKILECSSKGDKRFSAFYAMVSIDNVNKSIENHYQKCKRVNGKVINNGKGVNPDYIFIRGKALDKKYLTPYYKLLWVKYLDKNKDLVEYLKQYDDFTDMFKTKNTINCQADVIRQYIKLGRESIINEDIVKEFISIIGEL